MDGWARVAATLVAAWLVPACADDSSTATGSGTTDASATSTGETGQATSADPPGTTAADDTGGDTTGTTGAPPLPDPLCDSIAISLVLDPEAPVYGDAAVPVFAAFFDHVVETTGAELRLHLNVGDFMQLVHFCLTPGSDAVDDGDLVWGRDFTTFPEARDALRCILDEADGWTGPGGDGDAMFEGLLSPILSDEFPPPDSDVAAAMLIARTDDDADDAVSRPGLASEAFLRLAADSDRRRATAFAWGIGDELETFTLSISETSRYYDRGTYSLDAAFDDWRAPLVAACENHDVAPPPVMPGGCEHIDILFVVDGSFSMDQEQAALRGVDGNPPVFAEFTDALVDSLDTLEDFHVGVISSQPGDVVLHRHIDQPEQPAIPQNECPLPVDTNYIVGPTPDLETQFQCIAATLANTEETTAENAALALHHPANEGFLRDDAVLFVVMLTDEDTQGFATPRADVHRQIMDAVGDDLSRLVVLSIAGDPGTFEMPKTVCKGPYGGASPGRRLTSIVRTFREQGLTQDICAGDLAAVFDDALDDVVTTCLNFHPEG